MALAPDRLSHSQPLCSLENSPGVSICLGCYNKIPQTGWLKQQKFILTVLEAGKYKITVLAHSVTGEGSLPALQTATFSLCPHKAEREQALSWLFF